MLNYDPKRKALTDLGAACIEYQKLEKDVITRAVELYEKRTATEQVIQACKEYNNNLANSPKEFGQSISEFKVEFAKLTALVQQVQIEVSKSTEESGSGASAGSGIAGVGVAVGAGVAAGAGVATVAPTAAMAIATTFGTASTGTAISALSGAAATNAALAWLGGGALAAGGGGMVAGQALLALAGPAGWVIGGIVGGGLLLGHIAQQNEAQRNAENAEIGKIMAETAKKKVGIATQKRREQDTVKLLNLTQQYADGVITRLNFLKIDAPNNYQHFSDQQKLELNTLIYNIQVLGKQLNKKVS